jgi:2-polyprenyl-3-methyl-5-hydroxy-6-metoxy-1,4-benzoquinol methylase
MAGKELKPWFSINGAVGDRTLKQQLKGLGDLRDRVVGKSVLDVGCAEGLISTYLFDQGASAVHGIEVRPDFVETANSLRGDRACTFEATDANDYAPVRDYDIVIMLALLHKLRDPTAACKRFAAAAREMVVLRLPPKGALVITDDRSNGEKHDIGRAMTSSGFMLKKANYDGPKAEFVAYYERVR